MYEAVNRVIVTHREGVESFWYRLTTKFNIKGVISRISDSVVDVNRAVTVVFNVNVNDFTEIRERDVLFTIRI